METQKQEGESTLRSNQKDSNKTKGKPKTSNNVFIDMSACGHFLFSSLLLLSKHGFACSYAQILYFTPSSLPPSLLRYTAAPPALSSPDTCPCS